MNHPTPLTAFLASPELRKRMTFDQAMQIPHIATALKNTAEAMTRSHKTRPEHFTLEPSPCAA